MPRPPKAPPDRDSPAPPRAVVFDLGGVVVRIHHGWVEALRDAGLEVPAHLRKQKPDPRLRTLIRDVETGIGTPLQLAAAIARYTRLPPEAGHRLLERWLRGPYPCVDRLIEALRDRGVTTACLSNTNSLHWRTMTTDPAYAAIGRLHHRFASQLIGARKPLPRAYRTVERGLGLRGEDLLYFEDDPENCDAARNRGWRVHAIDPHRPTAPQIARRLVDAGLIDRDQVPIMLPDRKEARC